MSHLQQPAEDSKTSILNVLRHSYLSSWRVAIDGGKSDADHHDTRHLQRDDEEKHEGRFG